MQNSLFSKYLCIENRHFCLFLNYELFNTIALTNMNVVDVIKAFALIFALGKLIMFQSGNMIVIDTRCSIFITKTSLNFQNGITTEIRCELYLVPHGTCWACLLSSTGCHIVWITGRLKHTSWQHGYKLTRVSLYMGGYTLYSWSCIGPMITCSHGLNVSTKRLETFLTSRVDTITSTSRHHRSHLQPC